MLLLGIETSTRRVGVVLASGQGLLARVELGGYADPGPPRHAEQLTPAIEYCCAQVDVTLDQVSAVAVGVGPGHVHRAARRGDDREDAGAGAARPDDPAAEPRPARLPVAPLAVVARRRDRRTAQRALLRAVPGGARRRAARVGVRDWQASRDLVAELEARGEETLLCGDGALRYATELGEVEHAELAGPAHAAPSLAALSELAIARYEREEFCSPDDVLPLYLRKSDAELAWDAKDR